MRKKCNYTCNMLIVSLKVSMICELHAYFCYSPSSGFSQSIVVHPWFPPDLESLAGSRCRFLSSQILVDYTLYTCTRDATRNDPPFSRIFALRDEIYEFRIKRSNICSATLHFETQRSRLATHDLRNERKKWGNELNNRDRYVRRRTR